MKKMKSPQKQHKPSKKVRNRNRYENKKRNKNSKLKSFFQYLFLIIFILLLVYIAKLIIGYKINKFFDEKKDPEIMSYKGIKLKKKKIIEDYLSFAAENENHKLGENNSLYHLFYLDEYPNNKKKRLEIKLTDFDGVGEGSGLSPSLSPNLYFGKKYLSPYLPSLSFCTLAYIL